MSEDEFRNRLIELRMQKGVSARRMSLDMGQGETYINNIESQNKMPSMAGFFYICEYLGLTPQEFFDEGMESPDEIRKLVQDFQKLMPEQRKIILSLLKSIK